MYCESNWSQFPNTLPDATDKVWKITLGKDIDNTIRTVLIHCNNVEVLNMKMSASNCDGNRSWNAYWWRDKVQISFFKKDTASKYYKLVTGN